jgi:hypothetical protein
LLLSRGLRLCRREQTRAKASSLRAGLIRIFSSAIGPPHSTPASATAIFPDFLGASTTRAELAIPVATQTIVGIVCGKTRAFNWLVAEAV